MATSKYRGDFKVGDRIKVISDQTSHFGRTGTIFAYGKNQNNGFAQIIFDDVYSTLSQSVEDNPGSRPSRICVLS